MFLPLKVPGPFPSPGSILDQDHILLSVPGPVPGPGPGLGPGSGVVQRESPQIDLVKTVEIQMVQLNKVRPRSCSLGIVGNV